MKLKSLLITLLFAISCASKEKELNMPGDVSQESSKTTVKNCESTILKKSSTVISPAESLYLSITEGCPELARAVLIADNKEAIYKETADFIKKIDPYMTKFINDNKNADEDAPAAEEFKSKLAPMNSLKTFLDENCLSKKDRSSCKSLNKFKIYLKKLNKQLSSAIAEFENKNKKESVKNDPEKIFKMSFCKKPNLFTVLFIEPSQVEPKCIYSLASTSGRLLVIQTIKDGILVGQSSHLFSSKIIFIKTKTQYADGDQIHDQFVYSTGLKKYTAITGAQKTVSSFQFLGNGEQVDD